MLKKNSDVRTTIMEQIQDVEKCLIVFENFMRAETTPETVPETLRALCVSVQEAEREADTSLRAMIDSLSTGTFLPSTCEDLIAIATSCDKVANKCETIAKNIVFEHFRFPANCAADIMEIIAITKKQFELLEQAIDMLFSKLNALQQDHSILDEIRALESKVDAIEDRLHEATFDTDAELAAKRQIAFLIELLCDLSDIIEDIADKVQIMLITRKV